MPEGHDGAAPTGADGSSVASGDASDAAPPRDDAGTDANGQNDAGSNDAAGDDGATDSANDGAVDAPNDATSNAHDAGGADTGAIVDSGSDVVIPPVDSGGSGDGHVLFMMPGGHWNRIDAKAGASPYDVDAKLNAVSSGSDQWASLSRDGASIVIVGSRFACAADDCVAIASSAGTSGGEVTQGGAVVAAAARPAIASGAGIVVYPATGGPHTTDLYAIVHGASGWSAPRLLTAGSPGAYQHDVALSFDGTKAVFVCGPSPYQVSKSSICVANVDGSGTQVAVAYTAGPGATSTSVTHHPDYAPDGSIVFEADWGGSERIWRDRGGTLTMVSPSGVSDDNSPCVLPDGRIASLWLGRVGNTQNYHELKVMNADGSGGTMLVTGVDLVDVGESCGW